MAPFHCAASGDCAKLSATPNHIALLVLSDFVRYLAEELLRPLFEQFAHFLGRLIVMVITFGSVQCDSFGKETSWRKHRRTYGWLGIYRRHGRTIALSGAFTSMLGILLPIGVYVYLYVLKNS